VAVNWKAVVVGGVVFWVLAYLLYFAGGLAGFGNVLAALVGGFVAVWMAKDKTPKDGAVSGVVAGVIGAVIAAVLSYAGLAYASWFYSLGAGAVVDWVVWGLVFGAIGGVVSTYVKK